MSRQEGGGEEGLEKKSSLYSDSSAVTLFRLKGLDHLLRFFFSSPPPSSRRNEIEGKFVSVLLLSSLTFAQILYSPLSFFAKVSSFVIGCSLYGAWGTFASLLRDLSRGILFAGWRRFTGAGVWRKDENQGQTAFSTARLVVGVSLFFGWAKHGWCTGYTAARIDVSKTGGGETNRSGSCLW